MILSFTTAWLNLNTVESLNSKRWIVNYNGNNKQLLVRHLLNNSIEYTLNSKILALKSLLITGGQKKNRAARKMNQVRTYFSCCYPSQPTKYIILIPILSVVRKNWLSFKVFFQISLKIWLSFDLLGQNVNSKLRCSLRSTMREKSHYSF